MRGVDAKGRGGGGVKMQWRVCRKRGVYGCGDVRIPAGVDAVEGEKRREGARSAGEELPYIPDGLTVRLRRRFASLKSAHTN